MESMEQINYSCEEERTYSMLCHLSALSGLIIPFGHILGPLVIWLIKKDQYTEVNRQGKAALNFHISLTIYAMIAGILVILLIGFVLLPLIFLFGLTCTIIAAVKSSNCERFEYPLTIQLIN
ncbi:orotate phosphoribosyltransferase [Tenuifilaceae bacterium CYCD]|nr:orotate phosphoribosyltransferase [Tenuifilaceae bacterium CYCD]